MGKLCYLLIVFSFVQSLGLGLLFLKSTQQYSNKMKDRKKKNFSRNKFLGCYTPTLLLCERFIFILQKKIVMQSP